MSIIHHIATLAQWQQALQTQVLSAESLAIEGFIHCCTASQMDMIVAKFYKNKTNIIVVDIDSSLLVNECKMELSPSLQQYFPHVYGTINLSAVIRNYPLL